MIGTNAATFSFRASGSRAMYSNSLFLHLNSSPQGLIPIQFDDHHALHPNGTILEVKFRTPVSVLTVPHFNA